MLQEEDGRGEEDEAIGFEGELHLNLTVVCSAVLNEVLTCAGTVMTMDICCTAGRLGRAFAAGYNAQNEAELNNMLCFMA